jgi:acetate kinase
MAVLSLNCGSSSVKYQLYEWDKQTVVASGSIDRISLPVSNITHKYRDQRVDKKLECPDHKTAISIILDFLLKEAKLIRSVDDLEGVGHRVVHGGDKFSSSVLITDEVLQAIRAVVDLAPLHNPPNIVGIESAQAILPQTPQVAIFDTAFHQTIPEYAYMYGLDYPFAKKYGVRKYGFHGSSHRYIAERAAVLLGKQDAKIISIHVGNGSSLAAIKEGKSIDTSMGMTPLQGVIMGTRSGDVDPAVVQHLMNKLEEPVEQVINRLNKLSGMLGISGISSDQRDIQTAANQGDHRSQLALEMQAYSMRKYIGAYIAILDGADAIVFTAGIGENSSMFRNHVCQGLSGMGIKLDEAKNTEIRSDDRIISKADSPIKIAVIPTNEEYIIARDVVELVRNPSTSLGDR